MFKGREVEKRHLIDDLLSGVSGLFSEPTERSDAARHSIIGFGGEVISCPQNCVHQYQILRAVDHSLCLSGLGGLAAFKPSATYCRLLSPTEVRYMLKNCTP